MFQKKFQSVARKISNVSQVSYIPQRHGRRIPGVQRRRSSCAPTFIILSQKIGHSYILIRKKIIMMKDNETPSTTINFRAPPRRVDHTYHDYSQFPLDKLPKSKKGSTNVPAKLHRILSNPDEYSHVRVQYCGPVFLSN
jgi:hypothetical protein